MALSEGHEGDPWIVDAIIGSLEDLEQEFLDVTGRGVLRSALTQAAGIALVKELDEVRLLPASFDASFEQGQDIYTAYCATCHAQDGAGLESVAPPLLRSQWVLQDPERLVRLALDGIEGPVDVNGQTYTAPDIVDHMPGVRQLDYSDQDIADVLTYVRNAWINQSGGVTAEQVASVRGESIRGPWTAQSLQETETDWTPLFNGQDLGGWTQLNGQATYSVESGVLVGTTVMDSPNSFLATDRPFKDFILEYEFLVDPAMNSGVQIRSNQNESGRVFGYQVEIDPSDRAWTAGIYDESRRGWLFNLNGRPAAQKAFNQNEWNHIRVEARGDHIRTWLNGVLAAELIDSMTAEGFIALQVHSIGDESQLGKTVQWRKIRIRELD